ncbi:MAG: YCII-related protein [Candidatus Beckwithbacteria bacterium GW2011_GWC2_47_9]|uniref:YCII-related protein n=1 Tax=Candidatus Beckwithbacteria bacterium GW2011_GWC2_47_9 TaxID=1618373 RepID=A0A0G1U0I2_9BACT|nr:MAG: YCII-related protein [Candidatus Beckwithbacteria bacterium GW2011_GWC2_47_9]
MQFLVIGKDSKDKKAMERRLAVREAHLKLGDEMEKSGERWYGCVMLDGGGKMIGSMAVMDFPLEKHLKEWLKHEPYVVGRVWKTIEIYKCSVKRPWKFNRPKAFFESRAVKAK